MEFAGDDLEGLAVEREVIAFRREGVLLGECGKREEGEGAE